VEYNLGVRVHYYAIVDFNAFITLVDEIGGIDINVPTTINDPTYPDAYYGYDPFYIEAGQQHLDGATALKYARTRHNDNDFNRAQRQQDVLMAVRAKVISFDMLPTLIAKSPTLLSTLGDSVETDMPVDQMIGVALLARDIPRENIKSAVIDGNYITVYTTPKGAAVLIPERDKIGPLMADMFTFQ
jgi:anionic cell wall polymer biosynthesis LytR-Cps2A-Psr (LCP) family protein